jgi:hypothetical protein
MAAREKVPRLNLTEDLFSVRALACSSFRDVQKLVVTVGSSEANLWLSSTLCPELDGRLIGTRTVVELLAWIFLLVCVFSNSDLCGSVFSGLLSLVMQAALIPYRMRHG